MLPTPIIGYPELPAVSGSRAEVLCDEGAVTRQGVDLQGWYRGAMARRVAQLQALRGGLQAELQGAFDEARAIGQALRGSGATFGFPELTAVAALLEASADGDVLRRVEGLVSELYRVMHGDDPDAPYHAEWLLRAADLDVDHAGLAGVSDIRGAWSAVSEASNMEAEVLAAAVARYLDLEVADVDQPRRSALRLVPEALLASAHIIPLSEDSKTITVATSEPTSLPMELEIERLTGRSAIFVVAPPAIIESALAAVLDRPAAPSPAAPRPRKEPVAADGRVLVVDDEPSARVLLRSLLEKRGFDVVEAGDGVDALDKVHGAGPIGLVVADLNMPRMDGLELIWELREQDRWAHMPVIVVTGETDEILETQLIEEGADDYIRKPVDPRLFLARVEATFRRLDN